MRSIKYKVWLPDRRVMMRPKDIIEIQESQIYGVTIGQMKEWVWLQFTGLEDKNGKEIYEGDVLGNVADATIVVYWDSAYGCWSCKYAEDMDIDFGLLVNAISQSRNTYEVLGNIYQNPELLPA